MARIASRWRRARTTSLSPSDLRAPRQRHVRRATVVLLQQPETPPGRSKRPSNLRRLRGTGGAEPGARAATPDPAPQAHLPADPNESAEAERLTGTAVTTERSVAERPTAYRRARRPARGNHDGECARGAPGVAGGAVCGSWVPGIPVRAVARTRTGAGDVFNGALVLALAEGKALLESARFANAAAARSVTRAGASQPSAPTPGDPRHALSKAQDTYEQVVVCPRRDRRAHHSGCTSPTTVAPRRACPTSRRSHWS